MEYLKLAKVPAVLIAATLAVLFMTHAAAQMGQPGGQPEPNALEREYMELQQRLAQAQQQAVESNPGLQGQMDALEDLVTDKIREAGYDPGSLMETMLAARGKMQEPGLSDAQRREIMQSREVVEAQQKWQEAQEKVLQDAEVQAAQKALEESMMDAMQEAEPETGNIIQRLRQIQAEAARGR